MLLRFPFFNHAGLFLRISSAPHSQQFIPVFFFPHTPLNLAKSLIPIWCFCGSSRRKGEIVLPPSAVVFETYHMAVIKEERLTVCMLTFQKL